MYLESILDLKYVWLMEWNHGGLVGLSVEVKLSKRM